MNTEFTQINFLDITENEAYIEIINNVINLSFKEENIDKLNLYVNIILTDSSNIREINNTYRNIDKETDVLSFPMFEEEEINNMLEQPKMLVIREVLGDIIISIEKVKEQAKEYEHSFERELSYMIVHGFYHLMGYDHMNEEEKSIMREKEENILNKLNIKRV